MPEHDFDALFDQYPAVIAQMPAIFTSHQFILRLAQQNQALYIKALHKYLDVPAPFRRVHSILAKRLHAHPELELVRPDAPSTDIFGQPGKCAQWRKLRSSYSEPYM